MGTDLNVLILFYKFQSVSNNISVESDLIICLYIHEVIQISILIQILHFLLVNVRLLDLVAFLDVRFCWLKGHAGHVENERCDVLAGLAARGVDLPEDEGFAAGQREGEG